MSSLRELAIAKLEAKAGQEPGHLAGQQVSHHPETVSPQWDSKSGGIPGQTGKCPAVPPSKARDSGTVGKKPGQSAGQQAGQLSLLDDRIASARLREWHAHLSKIDAYNVPEGFTLNRWVTLVDDCHWLYETHCSRLVRDGWRTADLFGLFPKQRGWGGLADRLHGARNVLFDDVGRAFWTRSGVKVSTCRGACNGLETSGLVLVWGVVRS